MAKIFKFPDKKVKSKKPKIKESAKGKTTSSGLSPFSWIGFNSPPGVYAEFNVKLLDKILGNFDDFDPPPPACA